MTVSGLRERAYSASLPPRLASAGRPGHLPEGGLYTSESPGRWPGGRPRGSGGSSIQRPPAKPLLIRRFQRPSRDCQRKHHRPPPPPPAEPFPGDGSAILDVTSRPCSGRCSSKTGAPAGPGHTSPSRDTTRCRHNWRSGHSRRSGYRGDGRFPQPGERPPSLPAPVRGESPSYTLLLQLPGGLPGQYRPPGGLLHPLALP